MSNLFTEIKQTLWSWYVKLMLKKKVFFYKITAADL